MFFFYYSVSLIQVSFFSPSNLIYHLEIFITCFSVCGLINAHVLLLVDDYCTVHWGHKVTSQQYNTYINYIAPLIAVMNSLMMCDVERKTY